MVVGDGEFMRILIVSDTHRKNENFEKVIEKEKQFDMVFHLGDSEGSEVFLSRAAGCPIEFVQGNNDFFSQLPKERELKIGKHNILLTHGHYYYVSVGMQELRRVAIQREFDLVFFGHTHRPIIKKEKGYYLVNPGSLSYPRQEGKKCSYCTMEIDETGKDDSVNLKIHFLDV